MKEAKKNYVDTLNSEIILVILVKPKMKKSETNQAIGNINCKVKVDHTLMLPVEILTKIFITIHQQFWTTNYSIARLRVVCKRWCNVIDENIDFDVYLNNQTLRGPTMNHIRVRKCSVDDLHIALPRNHRLFRDPIHIKRLFFNGKISRNNFYWLINQITKLDKLSVNSRFLQHGNALLLSDNSNEESILHQFWSTIEAIDCIAVLTFECKIFNVRSTLSLILSATMPNLKSVKIAAHWNLDFYSLLISFLLRHPSVIKIHLDLDYLTRELDVKQTNKPEIQDLEKIQLKNIQYVTHSDDIEGHLEIMTFIKGQHSLEELHFSSFADICIDVVELSDFFTLNQSTLTTLHLEDIIIHRTLDARIFQRLVCLKKLALRKCTYVNEAVVFPEISNLTSFPSSLEHLDIRLLICEPHDLYEMMASERSVNLKFVHLYSVGNDILTPEFVDGLVMKKGMKNLHLGPLDLSHFTVKERNTKKFVVSKNSHLLPISKDNLSLVVDFGKLETI